MGTCKLQAGALIASAFFFALPIGGLGHTVAASERVGTVVASASSKVQPEDFVCRGIGLGASPAEVEAVFGPAVFDKTVRIQGMLVKVCDYEDDFKIGYSVRTGKVIDIVIRNKKYTARNRVRYGATSAWIQQTYGRAKRELIDGSLFYVYANPANPHQHLMLETDTTDGHLTVMRITGLPLTEAEVAAMAAAEPELSGDTDLRTMEMNGQAIDTSALPPTDTVRLGGLTK